jgi:hypothetical protein
VIGRVQLKKKVKWGFRLKEEGFSKVEGKSKEEE